MDQIDNMDEIEDTEEIQEELDLETADEESGDEEEVSLDFDMESVPEHLRPAMEAYKKDILRGMNKKYQSWAEEKKSWETDKQKAAAFDQILNDPQKRRVFLASLSAMDGEGGNPGSTAASGPSFNIHGDEVYDQLDEDYRKPIEAAIGRYLDAHLAPALKPYQDALLELYRDRQSGQWSKLAEKYPGADEHREAVDRLRSQSPGLSVEQALFAVMGDKLLQAKPAEKAKVSSKKKSLVTKHNVVPASRAPVAKNGNSREASIARVAEMRRRMGLEF